jgi:predicted NodU family carbamoyl transferase
VLAHCVSAFTRAAPPCSSVTAESSPRRRKSDSPAEPRAWLSRQPDSLCLNEAKTGAGGAPGASLAVYRGGNHESERKRGTRLPDALKAAYLGPDYEQTDSERPLSESGAVFGGGVDARLIELTATELDNGQAAGGSGRR